MKIDERGYNKYMLLKVIKISIALIFIAAISLTIVRMIAIYNQTKHVNSYEECRQNPLSNINRISGECTTLMDQKFTTYTNTNTSQVTLSDLSFTPSMPHIYDNEIEYIIVSSIESGFRFFSKLINNLAIFILKSIFTK